jgi:predicted transcriptional regulator
MARKALNRPTDAELEILAILWELGPSTVREVHEKFGKDRNVTHTTTLKFMQIMLEKKLLKRSGGFQRPQRYEPSKPQERTQKLMVTDLMKRAFRGSTKGLVLQALKQEKISDKELTEIEALLDKIEKRK